MAARKTDRDGIIEESTTKGQRRSLRLSERRSSARLTRGRLSMYPIGDMKTGGMRVRIAGSLSLSVKRNSIALWYLSRLVKGIVFTIRLWSDWQFDPLILRFERNMNPEKVAIYLA